MSRRWAWFDRVDSGVTRWMERSGHGVERLALGALFLWFGALKIGGLESATSIIAKTVYLGDPSVTVRVLGAWEALIGACFLVRPWLRVAILLLAIRLPGTLLALALRPEVCFDGSIFVPTIQGQYLLKDAALIGAALVIGATVRWERRRGHLL